MVDPCRRVSPATDASEPGRDGVSGVQGALSDSRGFRPGGISRGRYLDGSTRASSPGADARGDRADNGSRWASSHNGRAAPFAGCGDIHGRGLVVSAPRKKGGYHRRKCCSLAQSYHRYAIQPRSTACPLDSGASRSVDSQTGFPRLQLRGVGLYHGRLLTTIAALHGLSVL